jgi:hypothetical protein
MTTITAIASARDVVEIGSYVVVFPVVTFPVVKTKDAPVRRTDSDCNRHSWDQSS